MNQIIISNDFDAVRRELLARGNVHFYEFERLGIDETARGVGVRQILEFAYITDESLKTIVIMARFFGTEAQNALLKALEEPPRGVEFVLVATNKNLLLPTIRSRLPVRDLRVAQAWCDLGGLDLARLDLAGVWGFLQSPLVQGLMKKTESADGGESAGGAGGAGNLGDGGGDAGAGGGFGGGGGANSNSRGGDGANFGGNSRGGSVNSSGNFGANSNLSGGAGANSATNSATPAPKESPKSALLNLVKTLICTALKSGHFAFTGADFAYFSNVLRLIVTDTGGLRATAVLAPILLLFLERKNGHFCA